MLARQREYDALDRLTRTTYPDGRIISTTYDQPGNRTSLTNPGGVTLHAFYDRANRLERLTQGALTWTFAYDGAGNRTRLTHPNGTSIEYAYLANHWLQAITDKTPGGTTFQRVSYGYDPNGNRTSQTDSSGTTAFEYDALNRLIRAAYPGTFGTWTWTYDAVGNRTRQTAPPGAVLPGVGAVPPVLDYAYDANNRLTQAGSTTYTYDANGNLTAISTGQTFAWDVFNRLTQATGPGGTVSYTYNGDGLKIRRVGPDGTRRYYYDGIKPIWEGNDAGSLLQQYDRDIFGNLLSRQDSAGVRRYYHFDGLGSTTALTTETGAATSTLLYDAWGNQRAATGSDQGRYRFTGAELDAATGLYHMGARFYDPTIGRWLSEDPVQDKHFEPATLNFYAYVNGNPLSYVDPDGKVPVLPLLGIALGAAWGVLEAVLTIADIRNAIQTLQSNASAPDKAIAVGLALAGILGPGGGLGSFKGTAARFLNSGRHVGFIGQVAGYTDAQLQRAARSFSRNIEEHTERMKAAAAAGDKRLAEDMRNQIAKFWEQLQIILEEMERRGLWLP